MFLACVASVSLEFPCKFRCFGRAKIKARAKKERGGRGRVSLYFLFGFLCMFFCLFYASFYLCLSVSKAKIFKS